MNGRRCLQLIAENSFDCGSHRAGVGGALCWCPLQGRHSDLPQARPLGLFMTAGAHRPSSLGPLLLLASWVATFYLEYIICGVYVYLYVFVCSHEFMCTMCMQEPQRQKTTLDPWGRELTTVSWCVGAGNQPRVPWQQVLLSAEPSPSVHLSDCGSRSVTVRA